MLFSMMHYLLNIALYFDPGLGAMIIQALVAAAAGILLFSKNVMYKVKSFFGLTKKQEDGYDSIDIEDDESHEDEPKK